MYWWIGEDAVGDMADGTVMAYSNTHAWIVALVEAWKSNIDVLHVYDSDPFGEE